MLLPKGMINPFLKNTNNGNFEADNALVVVYNGFEAGHSKELFDFINSNQSKSVLIVVERTQDEDFIRRLASANQNGFNTCLIECPFYDTQREMLLEDIALYSGGEVFVQGSSKEIKAGKLDRVVVTANTTSLIKAEISQEVKSKIEDLEEELKTTKEKQFIKRRIQLLNGVAATINVGAVTETERREIFDRVEDAVHAVKASVEEGWVAGGGASLANISKNMRQHLDNADAQKGYDIIKKSILASFYQICNNANRKGDNYIGSTIIYGYGYNAKKDEVSNLIEDGIIDSVKCLRISLENAISVAKLLLNIKVVVSLE
jgi:chaperonin GroEL